MSINKHVDDHYTTGIAQVSIRDRLCDISDTLVVPFVVFVIILFQGARAPQFNNCQPI